MANSRVNFLAKILIRCWDINKTRQGITFICRTLYMVWAWKLLFDDVFMFYCRIIQQRCRSTHSLLIKMKSTRPTFSVELDEFICRWYLCLHCCNG